MANEAEITFVLPEAGLTKLKLRSYSEAGPEAGRPFAGLSAQIDELTGRKRPAIDVSSFAYARCASRLVPHVYT